MGLFGRGLYERGFYERGLYERGLYGRESKGGIKWTRFGAAFLVSKFQHFCFFLRQEMGQVRLPPFPLLLLISPRKLYFHNFPAIFVSWFKKI